MSKNIVVLASYRTGSTALCDVLSKTHKVINLDEYFHYKKYIRYTHKGFPYNEGYVIKIMPDQVIEPLFSQLIKQSEVYGIYRKNIVEQIASYYIVMKNIKKWHNKKGDKLTDDYEIEYDVKELKRVMNQVPFYNRLYQEQFKHLCHKEFAYEDIRGNLLKSSSYDVYKKPTNYDFLITKIYGIMDARGSV